MQLRRADAQPPGIAAERPEVPVFVAGLDDVAAAAESVAQARERIAAPSFTNPNMWTFSTFSIA
jgi:hypothetical protein